MKDTKYTITYTDHEQKATVVHIWSGIASGILFLVLLFLLHWNLFIDLFLAFGCYLGVSMLCTPQKKIGSVSMEHIPNAENLEGMLLEAKKNFHTIGNTIKKIKDPTILKQAQTLNQISAEMIKYLEKHPDKITYARQFIDYYQETATKLLTRYTELEQTGLQTEDILALKETSKHALQTLQTAFEQQFQKLVQNEMIDMEAEIRLLEQTMKMENV